MGKVKVAIATRGFKGLMDEVSDKFALARTLTLATVDGNKVHIEVMDNPAASLSHGRGRTVVNILKERCVDVVVASEFGPGASALLDQNKIGRVKLEAGTKVDGIIRDKLYGKRRLQPK